MAQTNKNSTNLQSLARLGLMLVGAAALGQACHWWNLKSLHSPQLCLYHRLTGHDCPGCGMTRALLLLAQGRFGESWHMHPFAIGLVLWAGLAALLPRKQYDALGASWMGRLLPFLALALLLSWWAMKQLI